MKINFESDVFYVEKADNFFKRFKGLMLRKHLAKDGGLLLKKCKSVHTCFMKFSIDVIYLDENFIVVGKESLAPYKIGKYFKRAKHVLELNKGVAKNIVVGMQMNFHH